MTNSNYSDSQLQQAYQKAFKAYMGRDNVTGIDVGYKYDNGQRTDDIVVRIHVREKIPESALEAAEVFPKEIDGVPVDVIQAIYRPTVATESLFERRVRRDIIQPGISIGHPIYVTAGTFGAVVYDKFSGRQCVLSNWHVLKGSNEASPGDEIVQPGDLDGGRLPRDRIGQLDRSILNEDGDAAIAFLDSASGRSLEFAQLGTGVIVQAARIVRIGDILEKSGRTTGVTRGKVDGSGAYTLSYSVGSKTIQGFKIVSVTDGNPNNEEISSGGDSGSIWYDPVTKEGIGLHFAGETDPNPRQEHAIACHLPRVLDALNISLTPSGIEAARRAAVALEQLSSTSPHISKIIDEMKRLIDSLELTANSPIGTPIDLQILRMAENKLKNIEFRLQFELLRAEDQNNWTLADLLYDAIDKCQSALNAVRAALIRLIVIGPDHDQIIAQLRRIRQDIDAAIRVQQVFDFFIRLAVLVRRFVGA
jgi:endonuclease G